MTQAGGLHGRRRQPADRSTGGVAGVHGVALIVLILVAAGCATTTAPSRSPQIDAELRPLSVDPLSSDGQARQYFIRGMTEAYVGNHERAIDYYDRALRIAPETPAIFAAAAEAHAALGDRTSALYHAQRARELGGDNKAYHSELAQLYLTFGETRKAAEVYREMRHLFPEDEGVLIELARVYTIEGEFDQAVEMYQELIDEFGPERDVQREILHLYGRLGDNNGVERVLKSMIEEAPADAELHRMLSDVYSRQDRPAEAAAQLEQALELNPGDIDLLLNLTELYRKLGRADSASALLNRAIDLDGATPSALLSQAAPLYARSDDDPEARNAAEKLLERVLEMDPENADALVMLGDIRLAQDRPESAGELLYRALEENPRDPQLWMQASSAFLQAQRLDRAIEVADEGILLFPGHLPLLRISGYALLESYQNRAAIERFEETARIIREDLSDSETELADVLGALGLLYTRVNNPEAAERAYEEAVEIDPNNAGVLNNYAYSLADRGIELERAERLAKQAVDLEPEVASYLDTLGWVYFQRGRLDAARHWLEKAVGLEDASATVFEHLGDTYSELGRPDQARAAWSRAQQMNPDSTSLSRKLGRSQ